MGGGTGDSGFFHLARKLKSIKNSLRVWNKNVCGNTDYHIWNLEQRVATIEQDLQVGFSEDTEMDLLTSKVELDMWLHREETRLRQMAKVS